jgi:hypothetical protein
LLVISQTGPLGALLLRWLCDVGSELAGPPR